MQYPHTFLTLATIPKEAVLFYFTWLYSLMKPSRVYLLWLAINLFSSLGTQQQSLLQGITNDSRDNNLEKKRDFDHHLKFSTEAESPEFSTFYTVLQTLIYHNLLHPNKISGTMVNSWYSSHNSKHGSLQNNLTFLKVHLLRDCC